MHITNIRWTSRDPFNSAIVDSMSGQVLFNLNNPSGFGKGVVTLADAGGQVVAEYEHLLRHDSDRVTYQGQTHRISDWLPQEGFFSSSRRLSAPNGKDYLWKAKLSGKFKLVDARTDAVVAETHTENLGILGPKHNMGIDAGPEIVPFLDLIVLSLVVCEHERRVRQRRANQVQMMSAAGVSGGMVAASGATGCC